MTHADSTRPGSADVIIIGGGPAGTAALWALNRAMPSLKMVLIERNDSLAGGSSLASLENYRTCWPSPSIARMMARSIHIFKHADEFLGEGAAESLAVKERGYLFCAMTPTYAAVLRRDVNHLHNMGLTHVEYLDTDEVQRRHGWLGPRLIAAKYDPIAGWLDSNALVHRFARSVPNARIILDVRETRLKIEAGRITGVVTSAGEISSRVVLLAAGAGSVEIANAAGLTLPVVIRPRQSFTTGWRHPEFPEHSPMVIGAPPSPHVRPEARDGAIFGWEYAWRSKYAGPEYGTNESGDAMLRPMEYVSKLRDPRFPSITLALLARQFGHTDSGFADGRYLQGISHNAGYYVYRSAESAYRILPDGRKQPYESERAIIDAYPGVEGLFVSIAHSGHGIMSSPGAGEIIASKVLGQPLADPLYAQFGIDVPWAEFDENAL